MFNSISWTDFLLAIGCLVGAYYFVTGLLFYNKEIIARLKGAKRTPSTIPSQPTNDNTDNLLGAIKRSPSVNEPEYSEDEDLVQFGESNATEIPVVNGISESKPDTDDGLVLGKISDLLEEVKIILSLFAGEKPSKEDLASTLRALLEKYAGLATSRYLTTINIFLYDHCKDACTDELKPEDVSAWWPSYSNQ